MTDSYHRFNSTVQSFAERLQKEIEDKTGIYCTIGIGSNMLLSKSQWILKQNIHPTVLQNGDIMMSHKNVKITPLRDFGALTRKQKQSSIRKGL